MCKFLSIWFLLLPVICFGGITGTITGRVTDSNTGHALPFASVSVLENSIETTADANGYYCILNIPPGRYCLQAKTTEHQAETIEGVPVTVDQTTVVSFGLSTEASKVTRYRDRMIAHDVTCSKLTFSGESIEHMAGVHNLRQLLLTVPGVAVDPRDNLHVRGGRAGEILYVIDGIPVRSVMGYGYQVYLEDGAIEEVEITRAGFDAEYGQAQSGVVNVLTRNGNFEEYRGSIQYLADHLAKSELNTARSFNEDRAEVSLEGPIPLPLPGRASFFYSGVGNWTDTHTPYNLHRPVHEFAGMKLANRQRNVYSTYAKLAYDISPTKRLRFGYLDSRTWRHEYEHGYKYAPFNAPLRKDKYRQASLTWNHTPTKNTYYNVGLCHSMSSYSLLPGFGQTPDFFEGMDWGYFGRTDADGFYMPPDENSGYPHGSFDRWAVWREQQARSWTLTSDISSQWTGEILSKTGLEITYHTLTKNDIQYPYRMYDGEPDGGPYPDQGIYRDCYLRTPWTGAFYTQGELKIADIFLSLGLRCDFWYPGEQVSTFVDPMTSDTSKVGLKGFLNPRLGIVFPITDLSKIHFSYGHFSQTPAFQYLYKRATHATTAYPLYGDPDLNAEKTAIIEAGTELSFCRNYKIGLTGYYKDVTGLVDAEMTGVEPLVGHMFANMDPADITGVEVCLNRVHSNYFSFDLSYTLQKAYGKSSSERQNYDYDFRNQPIPIRLYPLDWDQRHTFQANLDIRVHEGKHPSVFGLTLPDRWGLNVLWQHGSGLPYTPTDWDGSPLPGPTSNSRRMPAMDLVNLKANKDFSAGCCRYSFILEVENLFNRNNVRSVHTDAGTPEGDGREIERDPTNWGPRRQLLLGMDIEF